MKPSKERFKDYIREYARNKNGATFKILDLGSGTSNNFIELLEELPNLDYTAVEPWKTAFEVAKKDTAKFGKRARIINQMNYDTFEVDEIKNEEFDIVLSLSTLEHVKWLLPFLKYSAKKVKKGGLCIHLWDNAHALMPYNFKEKFQVFISTYIPFIIPAPKFVRFVPSGEVINILENAGLKYVSTDYNNHKSSMLLIKRLKKVLNVKDIRQIIDYEKMVETKFEEAKHPEYREKLFMSVKVTMVKE